MKILFFILFKKTILSLYYTLVFITSLYYALVYLRLVKTYYYGKNKISYYIYKQKIKYDIIYSCLIIYHFIKREIVNIFLI